MTFHIMTDLFVGTAVTFVQNVLPDATVSWPEPICHVIQMLPDMYCWLDC